MSYLEVVVLVDGASGVRGHISHGRQVHVLAGEQEEIHTAALHHALLRQLLIHSLLRLEQGLRKTQRIYHNLLHSHRVSTRFQFQFNNFKMKLKTFENLISIYCE